LSILQEVTLSNLASRRPVSAVGNSPYLSVRSHVLNDFVIDFGLGIIDGSVPSSGSLKS